MEVNLSPARMKSRQISMMIDYHPNKTWHLTLVIILFNLVFKNGKSYDP